MSRRRPTRWSSPTRDSWATRARRCAFEESELTPEAREILDRVARALLEREWSNVRFEVAGHTSSIGTTEYHLALSQRRAEAVRAYLVSRGVPDRRTTSWGYGETQPIFSHDSEGRAWQNRRVELRRINPWPHGAPMAPRLHPMD